jgi:hypothetical protein
MSAWVEAILTPELVAPIIVAVVAVLSRKGLKIGKAIQSAIGQENGQGNLVEVTERLLDQHDQVLIELAKIRVTMSQCHTAISTLDAQVSGIGKELHHVRDRLDEHGDLIAAQIKRN